MEFPIHMRQTSTKPGHPPASKKHEKIHEPIPMHGDRPNLECDRVEIRIHKHEGLGLIQGRKPG
jgi:hypothetical protein